MLYNASIKSTHSSKIVVNVTKCDKWKKGQGKGIMGNCKAKPIDYWSVAWRE